MRFFLATVFFLLLVACASAQAGVNECGRNLRGDLHCRDSTLLHCGSKMLPRRETKCFEESQLFERLCDYRGTNRDPECCSTIIDGYNIIFEIDHPKQCEHCIKGPAKVLFQGRCNDPPFPKLPCKGGRITMCCYVMRMDFTYTAWNHCECNYGAKGNIVDPYYCWFGR